MRIHETFGEDLWYLQGLARLWERICETLGEDLWGFARIPEDL